MWYTLKFCYTLDHPMSEQAEVNFLTLFPIEPQLAVELQVINAYRLIIQLGSYSVIHQNTYGSKAASLSFERSNYYIQRLYTKCLFITVRIE